MVLCPAGSAAAGGAHGSRDAKQKNHGHNNTLKMNQDESVKEIWLRACEMQIQNSIF
jgi:hypothetical protein